MWNIKIEYGLFCYSWTIDSTLGSLRDLCKNKTANSVFMKNLVYMIFYETKKNNEHVGSTFLRKNEEGPTRIENIT